MSLKALLPLLFPLVACAATTVSATATSVVASAPVTSATPATNFNLPPEPPPIKNKTTLFSILTEFRACSGAPGEICLIETYVVAKALDNGELIWDRRIFYRRYEIDKKIDKEVGKQVIAVKSLAFKGRNMVSVKNARGDVFDLEIGHGHLKSQKEPKEYKK